MACSTALLLPFKLLPLQPRTSKTPSTHLPFSPPHLKPPSKILHFRLFYRFSKEDFFDDDDESTSDDTFDGAVFLFNTRDYYKCHDFLESLWNKAEEPKRTLIHGILQCAVGFHHLFGKNHRGAMMELGEGLCKIKKMGFESGPFWEFEKEVSACLDFVYQTQLELAACTDDLCLMMDGSERSYQLLGSFAAGQQLYHLESDFDGISYIVFRPEGSSNPGKPTRVKVPTLRATKEHLMAWKRRPIGTSTQTLAKLKHFLVIIQHMGKLNRLANKLKPASIQSLLNTCTSLAQIGHDKRPSGDAEEAETWAIYRALELVLRLELKCVMILSDCQNLVTTLSCKTHSLSWGCN